MIEKQIKLSSTVSKKNQEINYSTKNYFIHTFEIQNLFKNVKINMHLVIRYYFFV